MHSRSRSLAVCVACSAWLALARGASAGEPWLELTSSASCSLPADELSASIRSQVLGELNPELEVKVTLSDAPPRRARGLARTLARIEVALGGQSIGVKRLEAAECAEALEAVVAVVALALSSEPSAHDATAPPAGAAAAVAAPAAGKAALNELELGDGRVRRSADSAAAADGLSTNNLAAGADDIRVSLALAADRGTLLEPTLVVGAGAALGLAGGELRSALWYALPAAREEVGAGLERANTDYFAGTLDYCRGFDAREWLSGCSGLELGVVRRSRELELPDRPRTEEERITPRLAAAVGVSLAYRDAPVQPALDVSAQFPLLGGLSGAGAVGLRAGLSAGTRF